MNKMGSWLLPAIILGIFVVPAQSRALDRSDVELPDISAAFDPVYHLDLRTTHTSSGTLSGVAVSLDLGLHLPSIADLHTSVDRGQGRVDGRSHKRNPRRTPPRPKPKPRTRTYYSSTLWLPIAVVVAVAIVITIPVMMVVYY